jgi:hypothetical protein
VRSTAALAAASRRGSSSLVRPSSAVRAASFAAAAPLPRPRPTISAFSRASPRPTAPTPMRFARCPANPLAPSASPVNAAQAAVPTAARPMGRSSLRPATASMRAMAPASPIRLRTPAPLEPARAPDRQSMGASVRSTDPVWRHSARSGSAALSLTRSARGVRAALRPLRRRGSALSAGPGLRDRDRLRDRTLRTFSLSGLGSGGQAPASLLSIRAIRASSTSTAPMRAPQKILPCALTVGAAAAMACSAPSGTSSETVPASRGASSARS